jgi:Na+-translocating ferredoxin:NAD+ oxidoreductase RnfG subunit
LWVKGFFITTKGERKMKQNKNLMKVLIGCAAFVVVIVAMLFVYNQFKPETQTGAKEVTIEVVIPEEETKEFTLHTDAEYLRQALEEENLIKGSDGEFGLFITEVNGRAVDDANQEWWCITKEGGQVNNGVDTIAIADGDQYEITLTVGY